MPNHPAGAPVTGTFCDSSATTGALDGVAVGVERSSDKPPANAGVKGTGDSVSETAVAVRKEAPAIRVASA